MVYMIIAAAFSAGAAAGFFVGKAKTAKRGANVVMRTETLSEGDEALLRAIEDYGRAKGTTEGRG